MPRFLARGGALTAGALFLLSTPLYARPSAPPSPVAAKPESGADAVVALPRLVAKASPYRPAASEAATITLTVQPATKGAAALPKDTELSVFYVRDDVGNIYWEQAKPGDDGSYTNDFTFPSGGEWRVFGEIAPPEGMPTVTEPAKLTVDGARPVRSPLIPQVMPMQRVSGYTLTLKQPTRVLAGGSDPQTLVFSLRDSHGQAVTDTDLWRGAIAHLILVDRDAKTLLHVLPDTSDPRNGRTEYLVFPVRFSKDGVWRGWVAFQRGGLPVTIPFALRVSGR